VGETVQAGRVAGRGAKVFDHEPVRGTLRVLEGPDDVLGLLDGGAEGAIVLVRDAGATFLAPIYHLLAGVICTSGTVRSHIGIVSREFQVPCAMGVTFDGGEPADGTEVELDCSAEHGVVRVA
jgi:signal transduction protein with GAF and PtsI domain